MFQARPPTHESKDENDQAHNEGDKGGAAILEPRDGLRSEHPVDAGKNYDGGGNGFHERREDRLLQLVPLVHEADTHAADLVELLLVVDHIRALQPGDRIVLA